MSPRRTLLLLIAASVVACRVPTSRPEAPCTHVQATREVRGQVLCEDAWTCARPPGGPYDRIGLHRLAPCEATNGPVLLYLPGMHMNGELPTTDARQDLRVYLAAAGVRTWGLDYRTHVVPANATAANLEPLGSWTASVFADDAAWAAAFVRGIDAGPFYLAGFSYGAGLAYRLVVRGEQAFVGLLVLDGAATTGRAPEGSGPAIDVGGTRVPFAERERLLAAVIADPAAPSPVSGYPSAGAALGDILYSSPAFGGHGGLADAIDGVSDVRTLALLLRSYDRWWPRAALAGNDPGRPAGRTPLLAFASTNMGADWTARVTSSARTFGGDAAIVRELTGWGHLDVLVGRRAAQEVFEPARAWLASR
jgi:pimeloyl-ACP methyl ester carboxylesterase